MAVNVLPPMTSDPAQMLRDLFTYLTKPHRAACGKLMRFGGQGPVRSTSSAHYRRLYQNAWNVTTLDETSKFQYFRESCFKS